MKFQKGTERLRKGSSYTEFLDPRPHTVILLSDRRAFPLSVKASQGLHSRPGDVKIMRHARHAIEQSSLEDPKEFTCVYEGKAVKVPKYSPTTPSRGFPIRRHIASNSM